MPRSVSVVYGAADGGYRGASSGSSPASIATGVATPEVVAVDSQYAYFTGVDDGNIYRVPLGP